MKNIGIVRQVGNDEPPSILERLNRVYGTPSLEEIGQALLLLHDPMDRNKFSSWRIQMEIMNSVMSI